MSIYWKGVRWEQDMKKPALFMLFLCYPKIIAACAYICATNQAQTFLDMSLRMDFSEWKWLSFSQNFLVFFSNLPYYRAIALESKSFSWGIALFEKICCWSPLQCYISVLAVSSFEHLSTYSKIQYTDEPLTIIVPF